jgi:hypothetical protein
MSWFGFGGSNNKSNTSSTEKNESAISNEYNSFNSDELQEPTESNLSSSLNPGSSEYSKFEQQVLAEQQRALVQAVMFKLTEISFQKCVLKPSNNLTGSERACIQATATKYLETSQFVINGLSPLLQEQPKR